ncbi:MAG: hypothetical protein ABIQ73_05865 [Acidimicrobiales bacterium]
MSVDDYGGEDDSGRRPTQWSAELVTGAALRLYGDVVKLFEGQDLATVDEVITTLYLDYRVEERAALHQNE